jgi:probable O-glycosylation ligase (exosortase A-associated)
MRDLLLLLLLAGLVGAALYRPWLGVLGLAIIGYLRPFGYATEALGDFPAFKVMAVAVVVSMLLHRETRSLTFYRDRLPLLRDWRVVVLALLWGWMIVTSSLSMLPWYAWPKFFELTKILVAIGFTLLLVDTREKLLWLLLTMALGIALVAFKGGYWAVMTGAADRVLGPPGSHFAGNNEFAVLNIMNIPLLALWLRRRKDPLLRTLLAVLIALSAFAALTSWSRGALLSLTATALLLLWHSPRKLITVPVAALAGVIALSGMPEDWVARMQTIETFEEDQSAQGRLTAWRNGLRFAARQPIFGTGPNGWVLAGWRDFHSAYIEMLAENGVVGFGLWLALLAGTIAALTRLAWRARRLPGREWVTEVGWAVRASLVAYAVGALFLGIAYWDILFHLILISVVLTHISGMERTDQPAHARSSPGAR